MSSQEPEFSKSPAEGDLLFGQTLKSPGQKFSSACALGGRLLSPGEILKAGGGLSHGKSRGVRGVENLVKMAAAGNFSYVSLPGSGGTSEAAGDAENYSAQQDEEVLVKSSFAEDSTKDSTKETLFTRVKNTVGEFLQIYGLTVSMSYCGKATRHEGGTFDSSGRQLVAKCNELWGRGWGEDGCNELARGMQRRVGSSHSFGAPTRLKSEPVGWYLTM